jgi:hypothetical protein
VGIGGDLGRLVLTASSSFAATLSFMMAGAMEDSMDSTVHRGWPGRRTNDGPTSVMARMAELHDAMPIPMRTPARLDALYDEAMARFDAFCFWYARPSRTAKGMREIAERLEAYGSPPALRVAGEIRRALDEAV